MGPLREAITSLIDDVQDTGLHCEADPQLLDLPGILVSPDTITYRTLKGNAAAITATVYLIAPNHGYFQDIDVLDQMMTTINPIISSGEWQADTILIPNHSPDPLPCLRGTTTIEWRQ